MREQTYEGRTPLCVRAHPHDGRDIEVFELGDNWANFRLFEP